MALSVKKRKLLTLVLPVEKERILLGMKKRGFGMGKWNGFGGKVEAGETLEEGAKREAFEECGIEITAMEEAGKLDFSFDKKPDETLEVHIYRVTDFQGRPEESEEMRPEWFPADKIPFKTMWLDDQYWFPYFLAEKKFTGAFHFNQAGTRILEWKLSEA